jgi:hypothetical protein
MTILVRLRVAPATGLVKCGMYRCRQSSRLVGGKISAVLKPPSGTGSGRQDADMIKPLHIEVHESIAFTGQPVPKVYLGAAPSDGPRTCIEASSSRTSCCPRAAEIINNRNETLAQALPHEFLSGGEYVDVPAFRHRDVVVLRKYDSRIKPWPGTQVNVSVWYVLANGKAVGWNENPIRGWTFPVITFRDEKVV